MVASHISYSTVRSIAVPTFDMNVLARNRAGDTPDGVVIFKGFENGPYTTIGSLNYITVVEHTAKITLVMNFS